MYCTNCGKKIPEDSKFCCFCASPVKKELEYKLEKKKNKKAMILTSGIMVVFLLAAACAFFMRGLWERQPEETQKVGAAEAEDRNEAAETEGAETQTREEGVQEEGAAEISPVLLVAVPAEYMSLRRTPGLGEDVIEELYAGTYMTWYGESETVNELEYYKVTINASGQEGYVAAKYCVAQQDELNMADFTIVEIDDPYYTYEMMAEDIRTLQNQYSGRITTRSLGYSLDSREIYEVVLGNIKAPHHIMVQASIHGREYMTTQLVMKMLEYYAAKYDKGSYEGVSYKDIFSNTAVHVVPMVNPDGVTISQLGIEALNDPYYGDLIRDCYQIDYPTLVYKEDSNGDMNWYDFYRDEAFDFSDENSPYISFEEYQTIWKANARGVDLNKNFDAGWQELDLKQLPAYGDYKGAYPVSEPEAQILADMAQEYDYACYLSYHSRGQLIYYDVTGNSVENSLASQRLAELTAGCNKYELINLQTSYNTSLGGFGDWVQLALHKPAITIENGKKPCPLPIEEFLGMWFRAKEVWAAIGYELY